jgi:hypothetical protein
MIRPLRPMALVTLSLLFVDVGAAPALPPAADAGRDAGGPAAESVAPTRLPAPDVAAEPLLPSRPSAGNDAEAAALANEILQDLEAEVAGASTGTAPKARTAPTPSRVRSPRAASAAEPGIDPELRDLGKAAWQWVKDRADWLRGDEPPEPSPRSTSRIEWADAGPGGIGAAGLGGAVSGGSAYAGNPAVFGPPAAPAGRGSTFGPEGNPIQQVIDALREIVEHPMTWLVIALVGIGAVAVKKLDRRPK